MYKQAGGIWSRRSAFAIEPSNLSLKARSH